MTTKQKTATKQEVLKTLAVQPYLLALWEKKAAIAPFSLEGEIWYTSSDVEKLLSIKELLYEKGYTLEAALQYLHNRNLSIPRSSLISGESTSFIQRSSLDETTTKKLCILRSKLITLRNLL